MFFKGSVPDSEQNVLKIVKDTEFTVHMIHYLHVHILNISACHGRGNNVCSLLVTNTNNYGTQSSKVICEYTSFNLNTGIGFRLYATTIYMN